LTNATFHVSEPGRQRVLREGRKNVHAVVRGQIDRTYFGRVLRGDPEVPTMSAVFTKEDDTAVVSYNPYKYSHFVDVKTGAAIESAELAEIEGRAILAINPIEE
jgi:hypothetical protein